MSNASHCAQAELIDARVVDAAALREYSGHASEPSERRGDLGGGQQDVAISHGSMPPILRAAFGSAMADVSNGAADLAEPQSGDATAATHAPLFSGEHPL